MKTPETQPTAEIRDVPKGCQEITGYILDVFDGSAWVTQDGRITTEWSERGVWPTQEAAAEMMERCLSPKDSQLPVEKAP